MAGPLREPDPRCFYRWQFTPVRPCVDPSNVWNLAEPPSQGKRALTEIRVSSPCPFAELTSFLQTFDGRVTTLVPRRRKLETMKTTFNNLSGVRSGAQRSQKALSFLFLVFAATQAGGAQENYVAGTFPRRAAGARLLSGRPPANREIVVQVQ